MAIAETREKLNLCSNCQESNSIEDLYKCTQCNEMDSTEINVDTGSIQYLCDLCTAAHLKKGHSVRDHRSLQPSICTEHKMVCLEYCIDCNELFCGKCLAKHRSHASKSMVERASEVRSKVFDLLTEWESNEKAALRKRESVSGIVNQHESEVETLLKQVEDSIDKLKEEVTAEIRVKFAEFKKSETRFEDHVQKVGQTQKELRGLLSMSDGSMIEAFRTVETNVGSLGVAQCEIEVYEINTNQFGTTGRFVELNERLFNQVVRQLKLPGVEKQHVPTSVNNIGFGRRDSSKTTASFLSPSQIAQASPIETPFNFGFGRSDSSKTAASSSSLNQGAQASPIETPFNFGFGPSDSSKTAASSSSFSQGFGRLDSSKTAASSSSLKQGFNLGGHTSSTDVERHSNLGNESANIQSNDTVVRFEPIVQLCKVETTADDVNEETVFSATAKLFRFHSGEWKERGAGQLKVMRNISKNVGRVIMRRDVILKLCANHTIFPDMSLALMPNSVGKAFVWSATDFADYSDGSTEKLCVRFKNAELGSQFEDSFNKMRELVQTELCK